MRPKVISLFAGIGGFDLGFSEAGMRCILQAEKDPHCRSVLARHFPSCELIEDVKDVTSSRYAVRPDVVCGGFPCQGLSVAGRRRGLSDDRSGLWWEFHRILDEFRPRWVCIENVPGLLSSWSGDTPSAMGIDPGPGREMEVEEKSDFAAVLGGLSELGYGWAYRIVDSQWFGVPQRRRRVLIVGCLGDARSACEILFERESLPWDSPPSREAKSKIASTISPSTQGHGNSSGGKNGGYPINLIPFDTTQMTSKANRSNPKPGDPCHPISAQAKPPAIAYQCHGSNVGPMGTLRSGNGNESGGVPFLPVTHPSDVSYSLSAGSGGSKFGSGRDNQDTFVVGTLQSHSSKHGHAMTTQQAAESGHLIAGTLNGKHHADLDSENIVPIAGTLKASDGGMGDPNRAGELVADDLGVRRLTPRECERLQGFPDDWTRWGVNGEEISDSARYRMLGNAVTATKLEWIGKRIRLQIAKK